VLLAGGAAYAAVMLLRGCCASTVHSIASRRRVYFGSFWLVGGLLRFHCSPVASRRRVGFGSLGPGGARNDVDERLRMAEGGREEFRWVGYRILLLQQHMHTAPARCPSVRAQTHFFACFFSGSPPRLPLRHDAVGLRWAATPHLTPGRMICADLGLTRP